MRRSKFFSKWKKNNCNSQLKAWRGQQLGRPKVEELEPRLTPSNVDVLTYHYDTTLSGLNNQETILTPANVNGTSFGKLFSQPVDGYVYASPLYKANLTIPGKGVHNVAFAFTEHNTIYAFDADSNQGSINSQPLWTRNLGPTVPQPDIGSGDIVPEIGITGTPAIDGATNTLYVVAKTRENVGGTNHYIFRLHAIDIATGLSRATNGSVVIGDAINDTPANLTTNITWNGNGAGSSGGVIKFNALREHQRPALTIAGGNVYVGFASHGDIGNYHGWVIGYQLSDLSLKKVFNTSANTRAAGIWQSGGGLASDGAGNLYFATGNAFGNGTNPGYSPTQGNYGETVLKLNTAGTGQALTVADHFTPNDWLQLDNGDTDLGSGGTMLLPDSVGSTAHRHLMVELGKSGRIYLIDRDNMGTNVPAGQADRVVQIVTAGQAGVWGNPSFLQTGANTGIIYYHGSGDFVKAYSITNGVISSTPIAVGGNRSGFPGGQPIITANGFGNAIAWDLKVDNYGGTGPATLYAYDATNLRDLYNSNQIGQRDTLAPSVKFVAPTVTNGHVLVGLRGSFSVFGLFPTHTGVPLAPLNLAGASRPGGTQVQITWTNPTPNDANLIRIERSTSPTTGFAELTQVSAQDTSFVDSGVTPGTVYYYRIRGGNERGNGDFSNTAQVQTRIAVPILASTNVTHNEIDLAWSRTGNDHYQVERSFNGGAFSIIAPNIPATQTFYYDMGLTQRGNYSYRITAFNVNPPDTAVSNTITATNAPVSIDHSASFATHDDLRANGDSLFAENVARLTQAQNGQNGTIFSNQRINVNNFSTRFTFRIHEGTDPRADGFTFIIQGNGPTALGIGGGGLGYGPDRPGPDRGIRNSVALKFNFFGGAVGGGNNTGIFTDGRSPTIRETGLPPEIPDVSVQLDPVDINNQRTKQVDLSYDGAVLHERVEDVTTHDVFTHDYTVNIRSFIGGDTAYFGFGGGTGGLNAVQDILTWTVTPGQTLPGAPSSLLTTAVGSNSVNLAWTSNSVNEDGFAVERAANGSNNYVEIARITSPRYIDTNLPPGSYSYRVRAFNGQGISAFSNLTGAVIGPVSPFTDHSAGFTTHTDLTANTEGTRQTFVGPLLRVTDGGTGQATAVWTNTPVGIFSFSTSFTYRAQGVTGSADGLTFAIQNNNPNALGAAGGAVGYGGIGRSAAVILDLYSSGSHNSTTKLFVNGDTNRTGVINMGSAGIVLGSGHLFQVDLAYDGVALTLSEVVTDTVTGAVFRQTYTNVNLPQIVQGNTAYVGFTGGTGGETAIQDVQSWTGRFLDPVQPVNHFTLASATTTVAGSPIQLTVTARDGFNNLKADYRGTVHFTITDGQTTVPLDYTFTAADNGVHVFSNIILKTAGSQTITLTDTVTGYIAGSQTITVTPAAASLFVLGGFPTTVTAGVQGTFTVTAKDPYGNTATGYTGTVTFSSTDPQAMLPGSATLTNGVGTFNATLKTAGPQSITARDGTLTGSQVNITVTPAATSNFLVAGFLTPTNAGDIHTFVVTAKDPYGNTTPSFQGLVHFSSTDPLALLEDDFTFTAADNGIHYSGAVLYTAGIQQISVTFAGGQLFGSQDNILVVPLAASTLTVFGYPSPVRPGVPSIITIIAQDRYGNTAPTYLGTVTFSTSDPGGFLPPDYTFTPGDNGVHQFAAVLVTPGLQTITATDTADGTILGTQEVLVVSPATRLFITAPTNVPVGTPFQITVSAMADDGNADALYTGTVHFSVTDPLGMLPRDYTFTADDGGVHTFTITLGTEGVQTLTADDGNFQSSVDIEVDPAGAPGRPGGRQNGLLWQALVAPTRPAAAPIAAADTAAATSVAIASDKEGSISASSLAHAYHLNQAQRDPVSTDLVDLVLGNGTDRLSFGSTDEFFSRLI